MLKMTKKTFWNTLLVTIVTVIGTSCNSAHELMEPRSLGVNRTRLETPLSKELIATDNQNKGKGVERNFVTSLNKFLNLKYANMLGVLPQVITNDLLYSFIDEWYGTRYRLGGTDHNGIDCSAFVQRLYARVFNISLFRTAAQQFKLCQSIWNKEDLNEGDLVFFNIRTKRISHVGIYLMNDYFVHSSSSSGVMISKLTDAYWRKYYAGAGRVPRGKYDIESNADGSNSMN
jgi:hypothetical protein